MPEKRPNDFQVLKGNETTLLIKLSAIESLEIGTANAHLQIGGVTRIITVEHATVLKEALVVRGYVQSGDS